MAILPVIVAEVVCTVAIIVVAVTVIERFTLWQEVSAQAAMAARAMIVISLFILQIIS